MRLKQLMGYFLTFGLLVSWTHADDTNVTESNDESDAFLQGIRFDMFDLHLCQSLYMDSPTSNVAVSPVSVKLVLAMLYEAAQGDTAKELQQTLNLPPTKSESRSKFGAIQKSISIPNENYELKIGSRIFVPPNATFSGCYESVLAKYFSAALQTVDFSKPREAAKIVNDWVCKATNGKITTMLDPADPDIIKLNLIVSNALFFKGLWEYPFDEKLTAMGNFYLSNGNSIKVQVMQNAASYFYAENQDSGYRIVRLPYKGQKYSLYIVLPIERNGLASVLTRLTPDEIRNTIKSMKSTQITLAIPKFKFQFAIDLEPILKKLGIKKMFSYREADFPQISDSSRVYVSRILHKAGLEVNELGSTVYASTNANLNTRFGMGNEIVNVDHPFVFFIKDDTAATIVFAAKVENPLMRPGGILPTTALPPLTRVPHNDATTIKPIISTSSNPNRSQSFWNNRVVHKIVKKPRTSRYYNRRTQYPDQFYQGYNQGYNGYPNYGPRYEKPDVFPVYPPPRPRPSPYNPYGQGPNYNYQGPNYMRKTTTKKIQLVTIPPSVVTKPPTITPVVVNPAVTQATPPPKITNELTDKDYDESLLQIFGTPPTTSNINNRGNQMQTPSPTSPTGVVNPDQETVDKLFYNLG